MKVPIKYEFRYLKKYWKVLTCSNAWQIHISDLLIIKFLREYFTLDADLSSLVHPMTISVVIRWKWNRNWMYFWSIFGILSRFGKAPRFISFFSRPTISGNRQYNRDVWSMDYVLSQIRYWLHQNQALKSDFGF